MINLVKYYHCEWSILRDFNALKGAQKVSFNIRTFNEEDKNSREYFDVIETSLKLNSTNLAPLKRSKNIGWGPVSLGANINFKYKSKTRNESKTTNLVLKFQEV